MSGDVQPNNGEKATTPHLFVRRPTSAVGVVALIGAFLFGPALACPMVFDDHLQAAMIAGRYPVSRSPWNLYDFISDADRTVLTERGMLPWWSDPHLRIRFFRPLSSLLLWGEHHVFGERPIPLHLHSFLWWLAAVFAAYRLVGALFHDRILITVATLAFAVAPCHVLPLAWLANREALVCVALGLVALGESVHYAKTGELRRLLAAGAAFCAALLAGEYALCLLGYAAAPFLLAKGRRKLSILGLFGLPTVGTLVVRRLYGFGAHGSGFYADPLDAPALFASHAPHRALVLTLEGWLGLDGETLPDSGLPVLLFLLLATALVIAPAAYRAVRALPAEERRSAVALLGGAFLAMIPVLAVIPSPRLLGAAQVGISVATGLVAAHYWRGSVEGGKGGSALATTLLLFIAFVHAPVTSLLDGMRFRARTTQFLVATSSLAPAAARGDEVMILRGWDGGFFAPFTLSQTPHARFQMLAESHHVLVLRRGDQSLELVYPRGRPIVGPMNLFRDGSKPLHTGDTFAAPGIHITVLAEDPARVRLDFDAPLDQRRFWANETYASFEAVMLPEVGFGLPLH